MNSIHIISLICALIWSAQAQQKIPPEQRQMLLQLTSGCIASEKVSDDDVNKLLDGEMPDNRESKCYITCVMKQFSLIQEEDGKTTLCDSCILNVAKTTGISKDKLDIITEITEACKAVSHEDKCEYSIVLAECIKEEATKQKMKATN